jgi:hypothetical protein
MVLVLGGFAGGVQVHVARGGLGRALAEIDERGASVGQAHQHEAPASDVSGRGVGHRQGEPHGHRGVDRVAAGAKNLDAGLGGVAFPRDHHGVPRAHRLRGPHPGMPAAISRPR